jgi:hypothetical protein
MRSVSVGFTGAHGLRAQFSVATCVWSGGYAEVQSWAATVNKGM